MTDFLDRERDWTRDGRRSRDWEGSVGDAVMRMWIPFGNCIVSKLAPSKRPYLSLHALDDIQ